MASEGWGGGCGDGCFTLDGDGFTCRRVLDAPEIWCVELAMEDTFLPSVNAFVVRDGESTLLVDAGTPDDFNDTRLMRALLGLGVDPARTDLFYTHSHRDHAGLCRELALAGVRTLVSEGVLRDMRRFPAPSWRAEMARRLSAEGFSREEASGLAGVIWDHTVDLEGEGVSFEVVPMGATVRCGSWEFRVVGTPGHTPGHSVLWEPATRTALLGDAVLFECSTCIGFWGEREDPIGEQISTLGRLADMGIEHALMGHGVQRADVADRCRANAAHHERRSARALAAIKAGPGRSGRELVPEMGWHAPFDHWSETPALTRWFLASESVAHLDHLVATGAVRRVPDARGVNRYWAA